MKLKFVVTKHCLLWKTFAVLFSLNIVFAVSGASILSTSRQNLRYTGHRTCCCNSIKMCCVGHKYISVVALMKMQITTCSIILPKADYFCQLFAQKRATHLQCYTSEKIITALLLSVPSSIIFSANFKVLHILAEVPVKYDVGKCSKMVTRPVDNNYYLPITLVLQSVWCVSAHQCSHSLS